MANLFGMTFAFLGLGSNLGDRSENLRVAVDGIRSEMGAIKAISKVYETEPWGFESGNFFLNMAVSVVTALDAKQVMEKIDHIEKSFGRKRQKEKISDRIIDIDLLLFDDQVINGKNIIVPHPFMHRRKFVLLPLAEIAGEVVHPVIKRTISQLLQDCGDHCRVDVFQGQDKI